MRTPVHIDSDANTIVDADGHHIVVLMTAGTHADLERIVAALNAGHTVSERAIKVSEDYRRSRGQYEDECGAMDPNGWYCTLAPGHDGVHIAKGFTGNVLARWSEGVRTVSRRPETVDIVFDGPPGPEPGRFVEVEDGHGNSIRWGEWVEREDGYWCLRVPDSVHSLAEREAS